MTAKIIICTAIISTSLALQSLAEEILKLELIAPSKPVVISKDQLQKVADQVAELNAPDPAAPKIFGDVPTDGERYDQLQHALLKARQQAPLPEQGIVLTYRITNLSDEAIVLDHGGDSAVNDLEIKGPGAVNVPFQGMMTLDFALGTPIKLEPGMSREFVISELEYGKRDKSRWLITKEGEYEVVLTRKIVGTHGPKIVLKSNTAKFSVVTK